MSIQPNELDKLTILPAAFQLNKFNSATSWRARKIRIFLSWCRLIVGLIQDIAVLKHYLKRYASNVIQKEENLE
jgi:hypothetical protein